ncbi:MAG: C40 family peptidase, partial [Pyrinomonadaceae bacterium]|nr:C40 family peptidase [Pyrinomonadaceae bacterium]
MFLSKTFLYTLAICIASGLLSTIVTAQSEDTRQRRVTSIVSTAPAVTEIKRPRLENDPVVADPLIVSLAEEEPKPPTTLRRYSQFNQLLQAAIDLRLGASYVYGAAGPTTFDCSGFVWAVFQSAGQRFSRTSANALW